MVIGKIENQDDLIDITFQIRGLARAIDLILHAEDVPGETCFAIREVVLTIHGLSGVLLEQAELGSVLFVSEGGK